MDRHRTLAVALLVVAALILAAIPTSATPLYTARSGRTCDNCHTSPNTWYDPEDVGKRKCTLSCSSCHVDPSGGGLRNVSGRYYGRSTLALYVFEDRPLNDSSADVSAVQKWLHDSDRALKPGSEPSSGPIEPASEQLDPRPPGSPVPNEGPAWGRPLFHGHSEMAWLDGRYDNLNADPLLQLGGDFRGAFWSPGALVFPMQLDLHAAVHPVEHLTLSTTVGARGRTRGLDGTLEEETPVMARDLWLMTHEWPYLSYARVGRFMPAFGWRVDDHTAFTRRPFGVSQEDPGNRVIGAEIGFTGNYPYASVSAFKPGLATGLNPFATDDGWGTAVSGGWRDLGWSLGASAMVRKRPLEDGGETMDGSLQWSLNPWRWFENLPVTYLGELAFGTLQRPLSGKGTSQVAHYHQLSYMFAGTGLTLHARYDFWDPDREVIDDEFNRPGAAVEFVVIPGLTLRGDIRVGLPAGAKSGAEEIADLFIHVHGWF